MISKAKVTIRTVTSKINYDMGYKTNIEIHVYDSNSSREITGGCSIDLNVYFTKLN